jgi:DNA-binding CsgD family transcriptional regulator
MGSYRQQDLGNSGDYNAFLPIFASLTAKQHEVLAHVAEGRSSKEIAWLLGVSDSAVNQRLEAVRSRVGSPTRAELARAYRFYLANKAAPRSPESVPVSLAVAGGEKGASVSEMPVFAKLQAGDLRDGGQRLPLGLIVPQAFVGPDAALNRLAAMVVIAAGLLTVAMIGLSVEQALAAMLQVGD